MPVIFNTPYTPEELQRLTGGLEQLAGIRLVEFADGKARGMRAAEVWNGSGLRFTVYLDRGMDIGPAEFCGKSLAWIHPALGTSGQYEPLGYGWLRTFGGGLVTTCGLTYFGHPDEDNGESLGLHGRVSHIPAQNVNVSSSWQGSDYLLSIEGQVRQTAVFAENLLLTRRINTRLGATWLQIEDCVRNEAHRPTPHMMLYHCNFGFPIVSPESKLLLDNSGVQPRDEAAARGLSDYARFGSPDPEFQEQVFFHSPRPGEDGFVRVSIFNPTLEIGIYLRYHAAELPALTQWKMMGAGEYVCGLEPCTVHESSRAVLRREGHLKFIAPGEEVHYFLEIGVLTQATPEASLAK
jgi:hypothetical protein